eukprot:Amastigsp_a23244_3.p1 type:complete len:104 gc:universal Amastigsp_a23244_3:340-29(-)
MKTGAKSMRRRNPEKLHSDIVLNICSFRANRRQALKLVCVSVVELTKTAIRCHSRARSTRVAQQAHACQPRAQTETVQRWKALQSQEKSSRSERVTLCRREKL